MPTDLKTTQSHPAVILRGEGHRHEIPGHTAAASALEAYEVSHDVTFVALDTEDLDDLRAEIASMRNATQSVGDRIARDIATLVARMLDLEG